MGIKSGWSDSPGLKKRFLLLSLVAMGIFFLLLMRLWYLQVIRGEDYQLLSEKNRIRYVPISAPRGDIYDRDGDLLVDNRPAFNISALRQEVEDKDALLEGLSVFLGTEKEVLEKRWKAGSRFPRYRPVPLAEDVPRETMERIQEHSLALPGVLTEVKPLRSYPYGEMAAHLFGYLGEITESDLASGKYARYRSGDFVGKNGLEKLLEPYLQGHAGERLLEVDVKGKEMRQLQTQEAVPGNRVFLTLKKDVQLAAEQAFGDQAGAAVALDVKTGEVLAMASAPSFSPAAFARGIRGKEWIDLLKNPRYPLQNKALQGQYPPASTFKIVTALAALREGVATPRTTVDCQGSIMLGSRKFRCWKKVGHGPTNLKKALKVSCDVWFYEVALELGVDKIAAMAQELGLGQSLGFTLSGEKSGLVPTRQWKKERFNERWYDGETVIAAIGQGYMLATPLQLAVMTAAVANGGQVLRPHVIKRIESLEGEVLMENTPDVINTAKLRPRDLDPVRAGLDATINEIRGTGSATRLKEVRVAGKTGTAQVVMLKEDRDENGDIPYRLRDHALIVAYAPVKDPEIAVAVVVEHGSHGGSTAGPIARAIFEAYFQIEPAPEIEAEGAPDAAGEE